MILLGADPLGLGVERGDDPVPQHGPGDVADVGDAGVETGPARPRGSWRPGSAIDRHAGRRPMRRTCAPSRRLGLLRAAGADQVAGVLETRGRPPALRRTRCCIATICSAVERHRRRRASRRRSCASGSPAPRRCWDTCTSTLSMKRSSWASGSGYVPSCSIGFCVASTKNGSGRG